MPPSPSAKPIPAIPIDDRCKYVAASGRRCRTHVARDTSRASGYSAFCLPHAQMEQQFLDSKSVAKELIGPIDDFRTSHAINEVLGKLLILVAENRIPLRNAHALSYICQLLLTSTPGVRGELNLQSRSGELYVLNRTTDIMYGKDADDDEEDDKEDDKEADEKPAEAESKNKPEAAPLPATRSAFDAQVAAAVKILAG